MSNAILIKPNGDKAIYVNGKRVATLDRTQKEADLKTAIAQRFGTAKTYQEQRWAGEFPETLETEADKAEVTAEEKTEKASEEKPVTRRNTSKAAK